MTERAVHVLVADGFADWEPSFALAEIRRSGGLEVVTVGFDGSPVVSMGGLRVLPDRRLADVRPEAVRLFLIPGGDLWEREDGYPRAELERLLHALVDAGVPVAAICGGTVVLARGGLLDGRAHASNGRDYLSGVAPGYAGAAGFRDELAVRDRGVITASGLGALEFAREIFEELGVFDAADRALWYEVFKRGRLPQPAK